MSSFCNKFTLIGRIGNHPELETTKNGKTMLAISIAVSERVYDSKSGQYTNATKWFRFVLWEKQAQALVKVLKQGLRIGVTGKLDPTEYTTAEGKKHSSLMLKVDDIELLFDAKPKDGSKHEDKEPPHESEFVDEVGSEE
jgi:single-strand DNA-binding protein